MAQARTAWACVCVVAAVLPTLDKASFTAHRKYARNHLLACAAGLWLQWKAFGPGSHDNRPMPGGPLQHYVLCMPLEWPPKTLLAMRQQPGGVPRDAGQAPGIVKYGKTIGNTFWIDHASTAHGFMYMCALCSRHAHTHTHRSLAAPTSEHCGPLCIK